MLSQNTVLKVPHQVDPLNELRTFISGSTGTTSTNSLELTKTSLFLLKSLPAARTAVLEYLRGVFDAAASNYIIRIEKEISTGKLPPPNEYDEATLAEIHTVLCSFVSNNAEAWAPIISAWSLQLLGEISTRYAGRAHICPGLNETLQLWMNCRATRTLIDITTQCLSCLIHSNTEACIDALLNTSVKHSPNFDWVVAHVGSCFPQTVIVRVLSCGLKDFCQNKSYQQGCDSPKLKSVVGILGHLATSHSSDIQVALLDLFKWCLEETTFQEGENIRIQRKATVPFLLHLLTLSSTLLNSVCNEVNNTISITVILKLYHMIDDWCKYFGSPEALQDLLVNLILKCERGGAQIINLLLDCISLEVNNLKENKIATIRLNSRQLLECILEEIDYSVRYQQMTQKCTIDILNSFMFDIDHIYKIFLSHEKLKTETAARIITYIGQNNPPILFQAISYILQHTVKREHLAYIVRILNNELVDKTVAPYAEKGGHFAVIVEQMLDRNYIRMNGCTEHNSPEMDKMWRNFLTLLKWEKSNKTQILRSKCISRGIESNLVEITGIFKSNVLNLKSTIVLCEILDLLEVPQNGASITLTMPLQVLLNFVNGAVNYFFACCRESDDIIRMNGFKNVANIFRRLCNHSKICRNSALRLLLEHALFSNDAEYFGGAPNNREKSSEVNKHLLLQNKKISKTIHLTKHSSVYNGGIIGTGKRKSICAHQVPLDLVTANMEQLIAVIRACCAIPDAQNGKSLDVLPESVTLVSLLLVQLVSPDVMYNGLPWPEEEFSKVTIERDLLIQRLFNTSPLLWDLLNFVGLYRPALCYCSVLIRALTATLMHQWTSMGDQSKSSHAESYKTLMNTTVRVIDVMAVGQLLPPPLSGVRDVVPFLTSHEIVAILRDCIWCYMRDHIPSPALFGVDTNGIHWRDPSISRPADIYTKTLKIIMQRNIKTVRHLYSQMFITVLKNE